MNSNYGQKIIQTNKARCRDCYRCLRVCPVKAIKMKDGQAFVDERRCVFCGTCVLECPQKAKTVRNDVDVVSSLISSGDFVAVSLAPSFASVYSGWMRKRIPSALRRLGFKYIAETTIGAEITALLTAEYMKNEAALKPVICSACPSVVNYIERYHSEALEFLAPLNSPMIAHAKIIRAKFLDKKSAANIKIVFIGPCIAKKKEAERADAHGLIDAVITFSELNEWFIHENVNLSECEESEFDDTSSKIAGLFPLVGGLARTASLATDMLDSEIIAVSGFDEVKKIMENISNDSKIKIIEPLFCRSGCINGPAMPCNANVFERRREVIEYCDNREGKKHKAKADIKKFGAIFKKENIDDNLVVTEEEIKKVLEKTGKLSVEDELNCGACGYETCRDKAVAVVKGMAEVEMCMPYMRKMAERRTDKIIETSPNGIIILDEKLHIISINNAFKSMFTCSENIIGKKISYLIDPVNFEKLSSGVCMHVETIERYPSYNLICHEILYSLTNERQFVGIFVNVTNFENNQKRLDDIKSNTVRKASELLEHQINMAQQMAKFLGEYTARGEELVKNLLKASEPENEAGSGFRPKDRNI